MDNLFQEHHRVGWLYRAPHGYVQAMGFISKSHIIAFNRFLNPQHMLRKCLSLLLILSKRKTFMQLQSSVNISSVYAGLVRTLSGLTLTPLTLFYQPLNFSCIPGETKPSISPVSRVYSWVLWISAIRSSSFKTYAYVTSLRFQRRGGRCWTNVS